MALRNEGMAGLKGPHLEVPVLVELRLVGCQHLGFAWSSATPAAPPAVAPSCGLVAGG